MSETDDDERPLLGAGYPWLCAGCRLVVDHCAGAAGEGEDTDFDPESACNLAYDLRLFCGWGGLRCENPPMEWIRLRMREAGLDLREVHECSGCGGLSAFTAYTADLLSIPIASRTTGSGRTCPRCEAATEALTECLRAAA
jgi:hypothetical protein